MREFMIGSFSAREGDTPYVIAEIGVNHEGSLEKAKELVSLAKEGGAHAAKFQTYKAEQLAAKQSPAYWDLSCEPTTSQRELFKKYDSFGQKEYEALAVHCQDVGIDFLSTPFDDTALEFLAPMMPVLKIASADLTNTPFLRKVAAVGKPVLLSTGASNMDEISGAVDTLRAAGCNSLCLLHCVLSYPTANSDAHLNMIEGLRRSYPDVPIGYSDHTLPDDQMLVLTAAWLKGAVVIEKHFTHDKSLPGNDHYHAMNAQDVRRFMANVRFLQEVAGETPKRALDVEGGARQHARRSIVAQCDIAAGVTLGPEMLTYKRPAHGVSPVHWDEVIGRVAAKDIAEDSLLQWSDLE